MTFMHEIACATAKLVTFGIKHFTKMNASNFPGSLALKIDPKCIEAEERKKISGETIVVVGTNGKTSVTNMIADALECAGRRVLCNRSGANMKAGVCTTLLAEKRADVGVFESDELWLKETLPALKAEYLLLLNLFRDQLDRCGEIERIQSSIVEALRRSPETQLLYNADDPLCEIVAEKATELVERKSSPENIALGLDEPLNWEANSVSDTTMCQKCDGMLEYDFRQYDKLGKYHCTNCGFSRSALKLAATNIQMTQKGLKLLVSGIADGEPETYTSQLLGSYNAYNMLFCVAGAKAMGAEQPAIQKAFDNFAPKNGRLQWYNIHGNHEGHENTDGCHECNILLNLAKNPTGFNQNLRIIGSLIDENEDTVVAFFINDNTADGHDISWIWDCDFEELNKFNSVKFFAGGTRKNDLQVRLKHASIMATLTDSVKEVLECGVKQVFVIANYTALPEVKGFLDTYGNHEGVWSRDGNHQQSWSSHGNHEPPRTLMATIKPVKIAHILPDLLNLYGDGGNVKVLENRLKWRGIPVEVVPVFADSKTNFEDFDIIVMGGSPDREQELASKIALKWKDDLQKHVEAGKPLLAICGSYQMLGKTWLLNDCLVPGLGILDIETDRPGTSANRLVQNIALKSEITTRPVIGFENHAGRTHLGEGVKPFGRVVSKVGCGNNEVDHSDGVLYKGTIGTYLHGPLLSKNPEVADWLIQKALLDVELDKLDDAQEIAANEFMAKKLIA